MWIARLACISITVTPHHNLTSSPPSQPITKYQSPLPPSRSVWVHPAGMNCIIDHLLYIHTGIIMFTITLTGLNTHGDKLDIKSQNDDQSCPDDGKISQLYTRFSHQPSLLSDHLMERGPIDKVLTNLPISCLHCLQASCGQI